MPALQEKLEGKNYLPANDDIEEERDEECRNDNAGGDALNKLHELPECSPQMFVIININYDKLSFQMTKTARLPLLFLMKEKIDIRCVY